MQISGWGDLNPLKKSDKRDRISGASQSPAGAGSVRGTSKGGSSRGDAVEISPGAAAMSKLSLVSDIRQERVEAIRTEIDNGTYLTPERVEDGLRKMLRDI